MEYTRRMEDQPFKEVSYEAVVQCPVQQSAYRVLDAAHHNNKNEDKTRARTAMTVRRASSPLLRWAVSAAMCAATLASVCHKARADWTNSTPSTQVHLDSSHRNNVFRAGEAVQFYVASAGATSYSVRDYYGNLVDSGSVNSNIIAPNVSQPGWYKLYLQGATSQAVWGNSVGGTTFCIFRNDARFPALPTPAFEVWKLTRTDPQIDFDWSGSTPASGLGTSLFGVRWTGQIQPLTSGSYTLTTNSDHCVRMWVNGQLLINSWNDVLPYGDRSGTVVLHAGTRYDIKIEYSNVAGGANAHLFWSYGDVSRQVVPSSSLYVSANATTPGGLTGNYYDNSQFINSDGSVDSPMADAVGAGPERYMADASDPAGTIALLDKDIAIDRQMYLPFDTARHRALMIAFPNGTKGLESGVKQIVAHFQNDVKYWESRNEPNFAMSGHDFATTEEQPFYQAVKSVDSTLNVIGPGVVDLTPSSLAWNEDFFQAGGGSFIDGFSFHGYNATNGDADLARRSLGGLNALLTSYNLQNLPKWQTEQGFYAAMYGVYAPRHQGRWTMLEKMMFEQNGIPKEHDHLWYDKSHGFWDVPAWLENADGSLNPAASLMRVWSEELYGTNFSQAFDFGNPGNKLMLGNLFTGANNQGSNNQVAVLMSTGATDLSVQLQTSTKAPVTIVSPFGTSTVVTPVNYSVTVPVGELPVYVEGATGQRLGVVPMNWGNDLALLPGTTASSSGEGTNPNDASIPNSISKIINGKLENWYLTQQSTDQPWTSNQATISSASPLSVEVDLPTVQSVNRVLIYACVPWQLDGSLLDYQLQYDNGGSWVSLGDFTEAPNTVSAVTPVTRTTVDSFYSDRCVFSHVFPTVQTGKIRLLINDVTYGGGADGTVAGAGGQSGAHQATLREIELYNQPTTVAPTSTVGNLSAKFYPRPDYPQTMLGGRFQGSNDNKWWIDLGTISNTPPANTWSQMALGTDIFRFLRYVSPSGTNSVISELEFDNGTTKLTGTPFGTPGSYGNFGDTFSKAFDGDTNTFFDAPTNTGSFVGIDLSGAPAATPTPTLTPMPTQTPATTPGTAPSGTSLQAYFYPRPDAAGTMTGGKFQGSNDQQAWTNLATIATQPANNAWSQISLGTTNYRFLRYLSPSGTNTVLAELKFYNGNTQLTGQGFGTLGSWANSGNTWTKAFDGDISTFFDAPTNTGSVVGLDTGNGAPIAPPTPTPVVPPTPTSTPTPTPGTTPSGTNLQAYFYPRADAAGTMTGGKFQGSNDGTNYTTLATITTQPANNQYSTIRLGSTMYRYLRYLSPNGTNTVVAELEFDNGTTKLTGTPFGTPGSYGNFGDTFDKAFDGDISTFFDAPTNTGSVVGLDTGNGAPVTLPIPTPTPTPTPTLTPTPTPTPGPTSSGTNLQAYFYPRADAAGTMTGGKFQGSNDQQAWSDLATIAMQPANNAWSQISLGTTNYRYLRYLSPNGTNTVIAELMFYNGNTQLTGTPFGTPGSYGNFGSTFDKAFDGDISTFFDAPTNTGSVVGLDTGSGN